jgi:hypothetical protein
MIDEHFERFKLRVDDVLVLDSKTGEKYVFENFRQAANCCFEFTYGNQFEEVDPGVEAWVEITKPKYSSFLVD